MLLLEVFYPAVHRYHPSYRNGSQILSKDRSNSKVNIVQTGNNSKQMARVQRKPHFGLFYYSHTDWEWSHSLRFGSLPFLTNWCEPYQQNPICWGMQCTSWKTGAAGIQRASCSASWATLKRKTPSEKQDSSFIPHSFSLMTWAAQVCQWLSIWKVSRHGSREGQENWTVFSQDTLKASEVTARKFLGKVPTAFDSLEGFLFH